MYDLEGSAHQVMSNALANLGRKNVGEGVAARRVSDMMPCVRDEPCFAQRSH